MDNRYGYVRELVGVSFRQALSRMQAALSYEGFGILTRIDVDETLRETLRIDFRPYAILGVCDPRLAHRALYAESQIGLILPCNVVVQASARGTIVSVANPTAMFAVVDNAALDLIVQEVDERLQRALMRATSVAEFA